MSGEADKFIENLRKERMASLAEIWGRRPISAKLQYIDIPRMTYPTPGDILKIRFGDEPQRVFKIVSAIVGCDSVRLTVEEINAAFERGE